MENRAIRGGDKMASCLLPKSAKTAVVTFNTKGVSVDKKIKKLTEILEKYTKEGVIIEYDIMHIHEGVIRIVFANLNDRSRANAWNIATEIFDALDGRG